MRSTDLEEIRGLPLFRDVAQDNFEKLMRGAYVQNFPPQVELITEGDQCDFLHDLIDGSVEQYARWGDRETTLSVLHPVSSFILAAAIKDAPQLMSARTLEKSRLILLPAIDVRETFEIDHAFARTVVTELANCYRAAVKNTKNLKLRTSIERLANHIIRLQNYKDGAVAFNLDIEKRRLASYLGMTPENLSRSIKVLRDHGVVIDGQDVTIHDIDSLMALAKPTDLIDNPHN